MHSSTKKALHFPTLADLEMGYNDNHSDNLSDNQRDMFLLLILN